MAAVDQVLLSVGPGETRLALMAAGHPVEFIIDRGDAAAGDVVLGRVLSVNRALSAAFVDIGEPQAGFLAAPGRLGEGDAALVQVTAAAHGDKGAALSAQPSLAGRFLAYSPSRPGLNLSRRLQDDAARARLAASLSAALLPGEGVVVRTAAGGASVEALAAELEALRDHWQAIKMAAAKAVPPCRLHAPPPLARVLALHPTVTQVRVDEASALSEVRVLFPDARLERGLFETSGAEESLEQALEPRLALPGGGALIIEAAAGLTVIDIDSGGGRPLDANLAAVPEIARQLRLRGIGGHILVDVIPLRDRRALGQVVLALRQAVADDPTPTQVVGATSLGLVEMTRHRLRPSLAEVMLHQPAAGLSPESLALAGLRAALRAMLERPAARFALAARPEVITALRRRPAALAEAAQRLGRPLTLIEDQRVALFDLMEDR